MNHEQMLAWLALEGWEPYRAKDHQGFLHRGKNSYVWMPVGVCTTPVLWGYADARWIANTNALDGGEFKNTLGPSQVRAIHTYISRLA